LEIHVLWKFKLVDLDGTSLLKTLKHLQALVSAWFSPDFIFNCVAHCIYNGILFGELKN